MADAGGVVYLLSSYQSGKERRGYRGGERGEGEIQEESRQTERKRKKGRQEHLVPV